MTEAAGGDPPAPAAVDLIRAKRDGRTLTGAEIRWLIAAYVRGEVADEQMSALLMAIFFRGLQPGELRAWTAAMIASGSGWICPACGGPPWTSTRPAVSGTRSR